MKPKGSSNLQYLKGFLVPNCSNLHEKKSFDYFYKQARKICEKNILFDRVHFVSRLIGPTYANITGREMTDMLTLVETRRPKIFSQSNSGSVFIIRLAP